MNEKETNRKKIGARCLNKQEVELILPTYEQIMDQIQQFRDEKNLDASIEDQKTNNIGIIGARGAGKTSVLKTIKRRLEQENEKYETKDVILPIIVPENMSESSTLMATILGMLNEAVSNCGKKQKTDSNCIRKSSLQTKYDEVVKQYTFIQKEYRDILIHEYTTENDYARSSAKVFNSDTEFIKKFNELIDELLNLKEQRKSILFLFIDDIDLSTYRCADVVKTLLSYLSNQNIVTFISGDLETFEEALTLDFLRKEKVLEKGILKESVLSSWTGEKTILENKKQLAYEYLKKIIPPVYRHNIKYWSLTERGNYLIAASENTQSEEAKLSNLLPRALEHWVDPAFFSYMEKEDDNKKESDETLYKKEVIPYTYHLFDDNSRGLNNIYNILSEIAAKRTGKDNNSKNEFKMKKQLLDTIISSKSVYNQYRDEITRKMLNVGTSPEDSKIFFDNSYAIIYKQKKEKNTENNQSIQNRYYIENPVERFSLFILVDFAARLLYENNYANIVKDDKEYRKLKSEAMEDLFLNPIIAEKVMDDTSDCRLEKKETNDPKETKVSSLKDINISFLSKGELVMNLAYYKNLSLEKILPLYKTSNQNESKDVKDDTELLQEIVVAFGKAVFSVAKTNENDPSQTLDETAELTKLTEYYPVFWEEFSYIQNRISSSATQNIIIRLFDEICEAALKNKEKSNGSVLKRILLNTITESLQASDKDKEEEEIKEDWQEITNNENDSKEETLKKRCDILKQIDSKKLWKEEATEVVIGYLENEIKEYLQKICSLIDKGLVICIEDSEKSLNYFFNSYHGITQTISFQTKRCIKDVLAITNDVCPKKIDYGNYQKTIEQIKNLAENNRVWYGRYEAQKLLNDLQKAWAVPENGNIDDFFDSGKPYTYYIFLLQCYYKYKAEQTNNIKKYAKLLKKISKNLSTSQKNADNQVLDEFIKKLKLPEDILTIEDFEALFTQKNPTETRQDND